MKQFLLVYFFIGMFFVGGAMGERIKRCPLEETSAVEMMASVAIWPVLTVMVAVTWNEALQPRACKP